MRKMIGLTMVIAALAFGSMTVYAAPVAVAGRSCTRSADCPVHEECVNADGVCNYEDCQGGRQGRCYRSDDSRDTGRYEGMGRHHRESGNGHRRGYC